MNIIFQSATHHDVIGIRSWKPWLYEISAPSAEINSSGVVTNVTRLRACCEVCRVMARDLQKRPLARFLWRHRHCGFGHLEHYPRG